MPGGFDDPHIVRRWALTDRPARAERRAASLVDDSTSVGSHRTGKRWTVTGQPPVSADARSPKWMAARGCPLGLSESVRQEFFGLSIAYIYLTLFVDCGGLRGITGN